MGDAILNAPYCTSGESAYRALHGSSHDCIEMANALVGKMNVSKDLKFFLQMKQHSLKEDVTRVENCFKEIGSRDGHIKAKVFASAGAVALIASMVLTPDVSVLTTIGYLVVVGGGCDSSSPVKYFDEYVRVCHKLIAIVQTRKDWFEKALQLTYKEAIRLDEVSENEGCAEPAPSGWYDYIASFLMHPSDSKQTAVREAALH